MAEQPKQTAKSNKGATVFGVTSGKGGVGKTSLSVNIACEFSRRGYRTIIVDTDLGLANTHIVAGMKPTRTLSDYLDGKCPLADIIETGPCKVKFISGGNGVKEMANLDDAGRARIVQAVHDVKPHCDVVILDTGAGVAKGVTDFVQASDHALVVTTSNFAAIADAYGIIKVIVQDGYKNPIHAIVNRVRSPEEAEQVFMKLKGCTERFLGFDLNWLGLLPEDNSVEGAVLKRMPFSEAFPGSVAARYLAKLVTGLERYVSAVPKPVPQGAKS
ncbi:MAG: MinD/ParA family protein [Planctomycetes bacterium]|nr:MinD/ParA family protein [Planctomycetota bacterium]